MSVNVIEVPTSLREWRKRFDHAADATFRSGGGRGELARFMRASLTFSQLERIALDGELRRYHQKRKGQQ